MSSPSTTHIELQKFVRWALACLKLHWKDEAGACIVDVPDEDRAVFNGAPQVRFIFDQILARQSDARVPAVNGALLEWLIARMRSLGEVTHALPAGPPETVHELAGRLFAAYQVDGGTVRLAGCTLEYRALLWLTLRLHVGDVMPRDELLQVYLGPHGQKLDEDTARRLGADQLVPFDKPPKLSAEELRRLSELARRYASDLRETVATNSGSPDKDVAVSAEVVGATVVWCKFAEGKLRFQIGEGWTDLAFSGWARTLEAPPFCSPGSQSASFHLGVTDDGRIAPVENIAVCAKTGNRTLQEELIKCSVTGQWVIPEVIESCCVTGEKVLKELLVSCPECRVRVTPRIIASGTCNFCPAPVEVTIADPRMARILDAHPKLDRWPRWRLAETQAVYILRAKGLFKRLLVVLDKESLQPLRVAGGHPLSRGWTDVEAGSAAELLD